MTTNKNKKLKKSPRVTEVMLEMAKPRTTASVHARERNPEGSRPPLTPDPAPKRISSRGLAILRNLRTDAA